MKPYFFLKTTALTVNAGRGYLQQVME